MLIKESGAFKSVYIISYLVRGCVKLFQLLYLPIVIFLKKRYRIFRYEKEISKLPEDSTDIFKRNIIGRYIDRPNSSFCSGKYLRSVLLSRIFKVLLLGHN